MISLVDLQPASQTRPDLVEVLPYTGSLAPATRRPHILLPMNNPCQDFSKTGETYFRRQSDRFKQAVQMMMSIFPG
jgi:hypothetical protein